jgi:hypothetical protein
MARASDLTKFCPAFEDTLLPEEANWDSDGFPKYIDLALRDWKWRSKKMKKKKNTPEGRYSMRVHRNKLDARFCPVWWLLFYWDYFNIHKGPIFQNAKGVAYGEDAWVGMTNRLFVATGLYTLAVPATACEKRVPGKGVTNHGIRKTALQWAGRCKGNPLDGKNTGRWKTYEEMAGYHADGAVKRASLTENGGKDPIWRIWVWKPTTAPGADGRSQM